ncbi:hypothetical protein [Aeromonas veronii]|uniref:hypothetical protein n=1 Tax=Aeromonas veronii TaxID=654 RepID=UPI000CD45EC8|nr:hypothetical protein [Aeromonas veronii]POG19751.1 hypothetical protein C2849_06200 [Aeromonas veronii]
MSNIDKLAGAFTEKKKILDALEKENAAMRDKQNQLKAMIQDANERLKKWVGVSPSAGVNEALSDRQEYRDLANKAEDAAGLLEVLGVEREIFSLGLESASVEAISAQHALTCEYSSLVTAEIDGRIKNVTDKLRPHIGCLAELAVIKRVADGDKAARVWAQAEFNTLLDEAMGSIDVSGVGVRMDVVAMTKQHVSKYKLNPGDHHRIKCMAEKLNK